MKVRWGGRGTYAEGQDLALTTTSVGGGALEEALLGEGVVEAALGWFRKWHCRSK